MDSSHRTQLILDLKGIWSKSELWDAVRPIIPNCILMGEGGGLGLNYRDRANYVFLEAGLLHAGLDRSVAWGYPHHQAGCICTVPPAVFILNIQSRSMIWSILRIKSILHYIIPRITVHGDTGVQITVPQDLADNYVWSTDRPVILETNYVADY
jgi:hypothetical protein